MSGSISGTSTRVRGLTKTYSITQVAGATHYVWTTPYMSSIVGSTGNRVFKFNLTLAIALAISLVKQRMQMVVFKSTFQGCQWKTIATKQYSVLVNNMAF
ncbi:MAG: hypothetical protein R2809_00465 [Flavobacteriales bacterium]